MTTKPRLTKSQARLILNQFVPLLSSHITSSMGDLYQYQHQHADTQAALDWLVFEMQKRLSKTVHKEKQHG